MTIGYQPHDIVTRLAGGGLLLSFCGNGSIDAGESCDFGTLNARTWNGATAGAELFGTLGCRAGMVSTRPVPRLRRPAPWTGQVRVLPLSEAATRYGHCILATV